MADANTKMNFLKRFSLFETILVIVILSIHLYAALSDAYNFPNAWFSRDDAFYYFKVAQNITEGQGSTFDGINLTNGYHPLWMLICIPVFALARFDLILPLRVLVMVMAVFNAATSILIYRLVKSNLSHAVAFLAAAFWAFNIYIHSVVYEFGLETPIAAFAVVLFIYKLSQFEKEWRIRPVTTQQLIILALIAVIVMFSRLDLVFLAIIAGVWIVFRGKPIRFFLPLDMVIIFLSMTSAVVLRTGFDAYNNSYAASALEAVILALAVKVTFLYFFGVYQHPRESTVWKTIRQTVLALALSTVVISALYTLLVGTGIGKNFPRSAFILDFGISALLILGLRLAAYHFGNKKTNVEMQSISPFTELKTNWKKWFSDGLTYYGILGGSLALYMLYNKLTFGTSSPVSGQIKRWWGTMTDTVYERPASSWPSFLGVSFQDAFNAWRPTTDMLAEFAKILRPLNPGSETVDERYYLAIFIFIVFIAFVLMVNSRRTLNKLTNMALVPLIAGCGLQILSYTTIAYGGAKEWYWVSEMILLTLGGSFLIDLLLQPLQKIRNTRFVLEGVSIIISLSLALQFKDYVTTVMRHNYFPADKPYMDVLPFLESSTPPGSVIGMTGGGNVGYFIKDRTIANMDGLINSNDYFIALQNKEAPNFLHDQGVDVLFVNAQLLNVPPYSGQFLPYLERYNSYGGKGLFYLLEEPKP